MTSRLARLLPGGAAATAEAPAPETAEARAAAAATADPDITALPSTVEADRTRAAVAEADRAGEARGRTAERARIAAIIGSDEADDRQELAEHFAFATAMEPEAAIAALTAAPKQAQKQGRLAAAMETVKNPSLGAGDDGAAEETVETVAARIVNAVKPAA